MSERTLYYIHDPMCSWCWGFSPVWKQVREQLPNDIQVNYLVGGLAPDSQEPMPEKMRIFLQQTWGNIQTKIPGTQFNFEFWEKNTPRRSTYPACRAALIARQSGKEIDMVEAIQHAYYLDAKNPSDDETLINLANAIGLDKEAFKSALNTQTTNQLLQQDIRAGQQLGAQGFPSLIVQRREKTSHIPLNYNNASTILSDIHQSLN